MAWGWRRNRLSTSPQLIGAVEQHVGAVARVHQRAGFFHRLFGIEHEGQPLVGDLHLFGGVFGLRAAVGDDRGDPFAGIARDFKRQRPPQHMRRLQAVHQRQRGLGQLAPIEHVMHARHLQRFAGVDADDARVGVGAGDQPDMLGAGEIDVGDERRPCRPRSGGPRARGGRWRRSGTSAALICSAPPGGWRRACARRRARSLR